MAGIKNTCNLSEFVILYKSRRDEETQFIVVWSADFTTKCADG